MATELVLLGTAGAPLPVARRGGISSALITEAQWERRAGQGFGGTTTAGRDGLRRALPRAAP